MLCYNVGCQKRKMRVGSKVSYQMLKMYFTLLMELAEQSSKSHQMIPESHFGEKWSTLTIHFRLCVSFF